MAALVAIDDANPSFHVPAKTERKDGQVLDEMLDRAVEWMRRLTDGT